MNNDFYDYVPPDYDDWYDADYDDYSHEDGPDGYKQRVVILANGDVWRISITWWPDGTHDTVREQLADTCFDGKLPF